MDWTIFDAAQAIAQHKGIAPEKIALALKVIGFQSHTPGLQKILRRAEVLAERFEELRLSCPGLSEIIDCFILAGRLANHVSPDTDPDSKLTQSINTSPDAVFSLGHLKLGELESDIFAISWLIKSVAVIHPFEKGLSHQTGYLLVILQSQLEDQSKLAITENLRTYPIWERLRQLSSRFGEDDAYNGKRFKALSETLTELSTLSISGLQLPTVEPNNSIQLQLTERELTSSHWHFPRPTDLISLRSLLTDSNLAETSPTWIESLIILIALTTGRDINQSLVMLVSGPSDFSDATVDQQYLAIRKHVDFYGKPVYAEWHIPIGETHPLVLPLPERIRVPLMRLIPKHRKGRLIDFLPPTSISWETRCNNLLSELFGCTHRQANLKVRDFLARQSYEISGNRGFIQWVWAGRSSSDKKNQRAEQISLSAYLNPKGLGAEETYKESLRKLLGSFGKIPTKERTVGNFGVNRLVHEEAANFLRWQIIKATENNDWIAAHNAFAIYSLCLLIVSTGHRKSNTPFFFVFDLHQEHRLAFIADKCIVGSEARFVPLVDSSFKQIEAYREHLQMLAARLKGTNHAVVRHISSLFRREDHHHKDRSISAPSPQEFGLFFQILPDGSIETIRTGQLDAVFQAAEFKSRIRYPLDKKLPSLVGQFRKCIADYLWDATQNGHIVAALLGHANDQHPFGPASAWTISDWSGEIRPLIQTYLTDRKWEVQESPLGKFKLANRLPKFSAAGLQTTNHAYEGRIKERQSATTRAKRAIKTILSDEFLEENDYHITDDLLDIIRYQIDQLLIDDKPARKAVRTQLDIALNVLKQRGDVVDIPVQYAPYRAESPIKISFSRHLSIATAFRASWIQLVGTPVGGKFDVIERLAHLAICLVVFDGVLDPKRIKASIESVIGGTGISDYVDSITIRAGVETKDHQFDVLTIPGDLSTAFVLGLEDLLQKPDSSNLPNLESVLKRIEGILAKIFGRSSMVSLELLCDIFKPWWLIRLPGAIYSITIGQHNGPCPNLPSEISLFASQESDPTPTLSSIERFPNRSTAIKAACKAANAEINQLLRNASGNPEKGTAHNRLQRRKLAKLLEDITPSPNANWSQAQPIIAYLISFTRRLIHEGGKKESYMQFSSIRTYLSWICQPLIEAAWDQDIAELDYEEANAIYTTVKEVCRKKRTDWELVLALFHQHLRQTVGAVDIPWLRKKEKQLKKRCRSSLFTSQAIDNAVVMLSDYHSETGELSSASLTMLAAGLGYGARRSESAGLKATDFDSCDKSNLAIRANVIRDLKSFASRRVISAPLLESKKLRESITQAAARCTSTPNREPYLLASYQRNQKIQTIQPIFKVVIDSLRSASGNPYAVYHDLRRTFATKLILAGMPLRSEHSGLKRARNRLLGNRPATQEDIFGIVKSTPKDPYLFDATARILGHSDESTLLNVYFLGAPIILADRAIVANKGITIDDGRIGNILSKDRTTIVKMKRRLNEDIPGGGHDALIRAYIPKYFAKAPQPKPPNIAPLIKSREAKPAIGSPWPWFDQVLCARKERSLSLEEMKRTAVAIGIPDEEATIFLKHYEQMLLDTGFSDFEPDNSCLIDGPLQRDDGLLRGAKERRAALRRICKMASKDKEFRQLLVRQISSWQRYVAHRDPWLVCRWIEDFDSTLSFLYRIGARECQIRCETVTTLDASLLQVVSRKLPNVIIHAGRRFSNSPSHTRANEIGINIGQLTGSAIPDGRDFHRMMALLACLPALKTTD